MSSCRATNAKAEARARAEAYEDAARVVGAMLADLNSIHYVPYDGASVVADAIRARAKPTTEAAKSLWEATITETRHLVENVQFVKPVAHADSPTGRDECEHGSLRRKCQVCSLADDVERLTRERDDLARAVKVLSESEAELLRERDEARAEVERLTEITKRWASLDSYKRALEQRDGLKGALLRLRRNTPTGPDWASMRAFAEEALAKFGGEP